MPTLGRPSPRSRYFMSQRLAPTERTGNQSAARPCPGAASVVDIGGLQPPPLGQVRTRYADRQRALGEACLDGLDLLIVELEADLGVPCDVDVRQLLGPALLALLAHDENPLSWSKPLDRPVFQSAVRA